MIIPTPLPVYTLSPLLEDLDQDSLTVVERCVASLTGHVAAVLVTSVSWTDRHVVVELESTMGPMLLLEQAPDPFQDSRR